MGMTMFIDLDFTSMSYTILGLDDDTVFADSLLFQPIRGQAPGSMSATVMKLGQARSLMKPTAQMQQIIITIPIFITWSWWT